MGRIKKRPSYGSANLNNFFSHWLRTDGLMRGYTSNARGVCKPEYLDVCGGKVFLRMRGIEHVLGFEELTSGNKRKVYFDVCNLGVNPDFEEAISDAFRGGQSGEKFELEILSVGELLQRSVVDSVALKRGSLTGRERKVYEEIFGKRVPYVCVGNVDFRGEPLPCVSIRSWVKSLPYGAADKLSGNLFKYGQDCILIPSQQAVIRKSEHPNEQRWAS